MLFCAVLHSAAAAAAAKSLQLCPTLCDPIDGSPPGSAIPEILQARTLEWVAISFSYAWKWKVKVKSLSCVRLLATPWTVAYQAPPSMGFSRQEYWSGCHCLLQPCPWTMIKPEMMVHRLLSELLGHFIQLFISHCGILFCSPPTPHHFCPTTSSTFYFCNFIIHIKWCVCGSVV